MRGTAFLCGLLLILATVAGGAAWGQTTGASPTITEQQRTDGPMRFTTAAITLKVPKFADARQQVLEAAKREQAELLDARTRVVDNGRQHGWVRLRLDADRLPAFLAAIRQVGTLYAEKVGSTDNLSEYESLAHRADRLKEHESRLAGLLGNQRRLRGSDILYVQERLFRASVDESELLQRRTDMSRRTRVASIEVALFEPLPVRKWDRARLDLAAHFGQAKGYASGVMSHLLQRAATGAAYAVVFAPFWVPAAIVALLFVRWLVKRGVVVTLWNALLAVGAAVIGVAQTLRQLWREKSSAMGKTEMAAMGNGDGSPDDNAVPAA
jgi:hypothetical protein